MTKRVLLAGILGGIALFLWGSVSHLALGLGEIGIKNLPNEQAVLPAMRSAIAEPGFYFFPGMEAAHRASGAEKAAAMKEFEQKYMRGPYGILIYHPQGTKPMSPAQLLTEFALNIVQALTAAFLLSLAIGLTSFASRVAFVTVIGALAAITTNVEYWNWYGFPASYTAATIADKVIGFLVVGIVAAAVFRSNAEKTFAAGVRTQAI